MYHVPVTADPGQGDRRRLDEHAVRFQEAFGNVMGKGRCKGADPAFPIVSQPTAFGIRQLNKEPMSPIARLGEVLFFSELTQSMATS
jgi:hypothetical protein